MTPTCQQHYDRVCQARTESRKAYDVAIQASKQAWADYDAAQQAKHQRACSKTKTIVLCQVAHRQAKDANITCEQAKKQWQLCERIWQNWQKRKISDLPDISLDRL